MLSRPQLAPYQYLSRVFCEGLWQRPVLPPWPGIGMFEAITTMKVCGRVLPGRPCRRSSWDSSPLAYTLICEFLVSGARVEFTAGSVGENNSSSECQRVALFYVVISALWDWFYFRAGEVLHVVLWGGHLRRLGFGDICARHLSLPLFPPRSGTQLPPSRYSLPTPL